MLALAVLFVFAVYLLVAILVTRAAVRAARARGIAGWKWGIPVALVIYLIVFWDHIPTIVLHEYECSTKTGLTVFKTPEQWRKENPSLEVRPFVGHPNFRNPDESTGYWLNTQFSSESVSEHLPILPVGVKRERIIDKGTNEVLVENVSVFSGYGALGLGRDWKGWVGREFCSRDRKLFYTIHEQFRRLDGTK